MTTQYFLTDVLPKDATGQPIFAPVDISTSQVDFALQAGVAASIVTGKRYVYQGVGTHRQADTQAITGPGVAILGLVGAPLGVSGNLQMFWLTDRGSLNTVSDDSYAIVASGSIAASANTAHSLFGTYNGLSNIATSVILYGEAAAEGNDATVFSSSAKNGRGIVLSTSATGYTKLPSMRQSNFANLHFANKTDGSNTTVNWFIYRRD
jgi:hypothetical protein